MRNGVDRQPADARTQLDDVGLHLDPMGVGVVRLDQVALERGQRARVVAQLVLGLGDVVEHGAVGRELVGAPELEQRALVVPLAIQRDAALKARGRLMERVFTRLRMRLRGDRRRKP